MVTLRKGSVISAGFHVHEGMLIKWQSYLSTLREGVLFSGQDLVFKAILLMMNMISRGVRSVQLPRMRVLRPHLKLLLSSDTLVFHKIS